jgi:hypothetical protein
MCAAEPACEVSPPAKHQAENAETTLLLNDAPSSHGMVVQRNFCDSPCSIVSHRSTKRESIGSDIDVQNLDNGSQSPRLLDFLYLSANVYR